MPRLADAIGDESKKQGRALGKILGVFTVATADPLTVYLDGSTRPVPGTPLQGASYSVGATGLYLLRQGQKPFCLPSA